MQIYSDQKLNQIWGMGLVDLDFRGVMLKLIACRVTINTIISYEYGGVIDVVVWY